MSPRMSNSVTSAQGACSKKLGDLSVVLSGGSVWLLERRRNVTELEKFTVKKCVKSRYKSGSPTRQSRLFLNLQPLFFLTMTRPIFANQIGPLGGLFGAILSLCAFNCLTSLCFRTAIAEDCVANCTLAGSFMTERTTEKGDAVFAHLTG